MSDTPFVPGLELSGLFYAEAVRPILDSAFPGLVYSAALIGPGSEVLGFDTARSTDHHWGPRLQLFLSEADQHHNADQIVENLRHQLPHHFRGYSTHFIDAPGEPGVLLLKPTDSARSTISSASTACAHSSKIIWGSTSIRRLTLPTG
jgi:hypothetical protein